MANLANGVMVGFEYNNKDAAFTGNGLLARSCTHLVHACVILTCVGMNCATCAEINTSLSE